PTTSARFPFFHQRVRVFHIFVCDPKRCVQVRDIESGRTTVSLKENLVPSISVLLLSSSGFR
ncbi:hypothetical protein CY34DRAFT_810563, partial [Suillus luteus UH-Slu-Lm8-n1]